MPAPQFIELIIKMHDTHTSLEAMQKLERWIVEHRNDPRTSRLRRLVPTLGSFFTPLRLVGPCMAAAAAREH